MGFVDAGSKVAAVTLLEPNSIDLGTAMLRVSRNSGIAFGLGQRIPSWMIAVSLLLSMVFLAVLALRGSLGQPLGAGLVLGGGLANLADRLVGSGVIDFVDLGWWPSFNIADMALCSGILILALGQIASPNRARQRRLTAFCRRARSDG